jgi:hypothetical protein
MSNLLEQNGFFIKVEYIDPCSCKIAVGKAFSKKNINQYFQIDICADNFIRIYEIIKNKKMQINIREDYTECATISSIIDGVIDGIVNFIRKTKKMDARPYVQIEKNF